MAEKPWTAAGLTDATRAQEIGNKIIALTIARGEWDIDYTQLLIAEAIEAAVRDALAEAWPKWRDVSELPFVPEGDFNVQVWIWHPDFWNKDMVVNHAQFAYGEFRGMTGGVINDVVKWMYYKPEPPSE